MPSVLACSCCTHGLFDKGHTSCVLTSPGHQDHRGGRNLLGRLWCVTVFSTIKSHEPPPMQEDSKLKNIIIRAFRNRILDWKFLFGPLPPVGSLGLEQGIWWGGLAPSTLLLPQPNNCPAWKVPSKPANRKKLWAFNEPAFSTVRFDANPSSR